MNESQELSFREFVSGMDFTEFYDRMILPKKGGGRDHMSPMAYRESFIKESEWIKNRCLTGDYCFSPYQEKLVLKGRGKYPRVLSIPIVRDRFVLSLLNCYLSYVVKIGHEAPNRYIYRLTKFVEAALPGGKPVYFFKTDISSFYASICHSVLIRKLATLIDGVALKLVVNAITTPTISSVGDIRSVNQTGVPQGLSISNILASVYMDGFHNEMSRLFSSSGLFLRYVDDILILTTEAQDCRQILNDAIDRHNLGLELTDAKTKSGVLNKDSFDYIGYLVCGDKISVKKANKDKFADRIVRRCIQIVRQYRNPQLRPRYVSYEDEYLAFAEADLNLMISGFRVCNHNYGWIAYFQQMNDLTILYQLDTVVRKKLGKELLGKININSMVRTYYDIKQNMGRSILINFDAITHRGDKIAYLIKFGYIRRNEAQDYSDEEIDRLFSVMVQNFVRRSEVDVRELS